MARYLSILLCLISHSLLLAQDTAWTVKGVEGKSVVFNNGSRFETPLYNLRYIASLPAYDKAPYLILSGNDCAPCDAPASIYINSPSDGPLTLEIISNRFPLPGREYNRRDSTLLYEGRAFYGMVLNSIPMGAIWYQKYKMADGQFHTSVLIVQVINNKLTHRLLTDNAPGIQETLRLVDIGKCTEIEARDYLTER